MTTKRRRPTLKALLPRTDRAQDWFNFLKETQKDSDRGCALLFGAVLDVHVDKLLLAEFGLEEEKALCEAYGIEFVTFPIEDRGVPSSELAATALVHKLDRSLARGQKIGLPCRQGIGRCALVAASLLVASGVEPKQAFDRVAAARDSSVPDTLEQERWVTERAASFAVQPAR